MRPAWFSIPKEMLPQTNPPTTAHRSSMSDKDTESLPPIPLKQMWADDEFWMPLMFSGRPFVGRADFDADSKMLKWWFAATPVESYSYTFGGGG